MSIRVVDARQALVDIRSGMDDAALMKKYRLSQEHLGQLFEKLESLHVLKRLNARMLLKDIRAGLNDTNLMLKYNLSETALQNAFIEIIRSGLSVEPTARPLVQPKKRISAQAIVRDIRSGMTGSEIMDKHKLSVRGLQRVFRKLVDAGWLTRDECVGVLPDEEASITLQKIRQTTRRLPVLSVTLYDKRRPSVTGALRDISDRGLGVSGMHAVIDETRTLVIVPNESLPLSPFSVHVRCRWFKEGDAGLPCTAGFEIMHAELSSIEALRELIEEVTLTFEE
jgi:uncharacterized protein (DUF433 family)